MTHITPRIPVPADTLRRLVALATDGLAQRHEAALWKRDKALEDRATADYALVKFARALLVAYTEPEAPQ